MATLGDDCFFYCTSTCAKGPSCTFRHVEAAKTCKIICQHWQMGSCYRPMCKFRHSTFPIPVSSTAETPCYWETQPVGCMKKVCPYKHVKPRPYDGATKTPATDTTTPSSDSVTTAAAAPAAVSSPKKPATGEEIKDSSVPGGSSKQELEPQAIPQKSPPHAAEDKENSNKENGSVSATVTPAGDGAAVKAKPKKKVAAKTPGAVKKKAPGSAVKKAAAPKTTKKVTVKKVKKKVVKKAAAKVPEEDGAGDSTAESPRKTAKERLGVLPSKKKAATVPTPKDSESGSDSDDSVENIKVLSMEEILRQRALESMMKKRAAEGKPLLASEPPKAKKAAPAPAKVISKKLTASGKVVLKKKAPAASPVAPLKKKKPVQVTAPAAESSEEEESSADSSSSSSSEESDSSEDSEPDVRRVVVEVSNEKAARNRAKASLLKKKTESSVHGVQRGKPVKAKDRLGRPTDKKLKRRMVNMDYDSDDIVSSRMKAPLNVRDRLGKLPTMPHAASSSRLAEDGRVAELRDSPRKAVVVRRASDSSSGEDSDSLRGVAVKTLEEIKREKQRKALAGSAHGEKDSAQEEEEETTMGGTQTRTVKQEEETGGGRQVLIANESKSDEGSGTKPTLEQKRAKRRPWRSRARVVVGEEDGRGDGGDTGSGQDDERTTVVMSSVVAARDQDSLPGLDRLQEETEPDESPFASLKRRMLMKKLQHQQQTKGSSPARNIVQEFKSEEAVGVKDGGEEMKDDEDEGEEVKGDGSHRKHKHKRKHKRHKKSSKRERQIYMPPALKSSAQEPTTLPTRDESPPSSPQSPPPPPAAAAATTTAPTVKVAPQRRGGGPHPIAAAWAAGLSLSSKGTARSRPDVPVKQQAAATLVSDKSSGLEGRLGTRPGAARAEQGLTRATVVQPISQPASKDPGEVTIKSFSEIMAEKRRKRLEMQQAKKPGSGPPGSAVLLSSSSAPSASSSSSPLKTTEVLAAVTSSPVKSAVDSRPRVPITPIVFNSGGQSSPPQPSAPAWSDSSAQQTQRISQQAVAPVSALSSASSSFSSSSLRHIPPSRAPEEKQTFLSLSQPTEQQNSATPKISAEESNIKPVPSHSRKKAAGQKKVFKKRKSVETRAAPSVTEDSVSMASMGISIPLPPMTLEEELLLDEGASTDGQLLHQNSGAAAANETSGSVVSPSASLLQSTQAGPSPSSSSSPRFPASSATLPTPPKHKLPPADDSESFTKKSRLSIDDELALFDEDMDNFEDDPNGLTGDPLEPIDDLLQNIDDLLA